MVYSDKKLKQWASNGGVTPYFESLVNPASINLRLSDEIRVTMWYWYVPILRYIAQKLGWPKWSKVRQFTRYNLRPGEFVLCSSIERFAMPDTAVGILLSRSSTGRRGIEHFHSGYVDPNFGDNGNGGATLTFELYNTAKWGNQLVAGSELLQLVLEETDDTPDRLYKDTGRYNNQIEPTAEIITPIYKKGAPVRPMPKSTSMRKG